MAIHSPDLAPTESLPFPVEQLPPDVLDSADYEQVASLLLNKLSEDGVDISKVVFCGFDAGEVMINHTYGYRDGTFAVNARLLASDDRTRSPIAYLEDSMEFTPAIGVYDISKMVGSSFDDPRELMDPVTPSQLADKPEDYIFWRTTDGSSLDSAAVKLFLF